MVGVGPLGAHSVPAMCPSRCWALLVTAVTWCFVLPLAAPRGATAAAVTTLEAATVWTIDTHACPQLMMLAVAPANASLPFGASSGTLLQASLSSLGTPAASAACPTANSGFGANFVPSSSLTAAGASECDSLSAYSTVGGSTGAQRIFSVERDALLPTATPSYQLVTTTISAGSAGINSSRGSQPLMDCAPQQLAYHANSSSLLALCLLSTGGLSLRAFSTTNVSVSSQVLSVTDVSVTLGLTHALVDASVVAAATEELYFLGASTVRATSNIASRLFAVDLRPLSSLLPVAGPFSSQGFNLVRNETGAAETGVEAVFWSDSLRAILFFSDRLRMAPVPTSLVGSAAPNLVTFPVLIRNSSGSGASTWAPFRFSALTPAISALLDSNPRWLEAEQTMLVTTRQAGSDQPVLLQLQLANLGQGRVVVAAISQKTLDQVPMRWAGSLAPSVISGVSLSDKSLASGSYLSISASGFESPQLRAQSSCTVAFLRANGTIIQTATITPIFQFESQTGGNVTLQCALPVVSNVTRLTVAVSVMESTLGNFEIDLLGWQVVSPPVVQFLGGTPARILVGDPLSFATTISSQDVQTLPADVQYTWTTQPTLQLGTPLSLIAGPVNGPSLVFNSTASLAPGSYRFQVTATDSDPTHRDSTGGAAQSTAVTTVEVLPAVHFTVSGNADPCAGSTLCENSGTCISTLLPTPPGTTLRSYRLSCACPTTPFVFYGPTCSLAVVSCSGCVSPYRGGVSVTIFGVGLSALVGVSVLSSSVSTDAAITDLGPQYRNSSAAAMQLIDAGSGGSLLTPAVVNQLQAISFIAPALVPTAVNSSTSATLNPPSAYQLVQLLAVLPSTTTVAPINFTSLMFYSSSDCIAPGVFTPDGAGGCNVCPTGAYCPGGGRAWPLPGYWSWSEYQTPIRCAVPEACSGVNVQVTLAGGGSTTSSGGTSGTVSAVNTQQCGAGYTGTCCTQCAASYYQQSSRCLYCGSSTDQSTTIALTAIVALGAMSTLAAGIAYLDPVPLAYAAQGFMILQNLASIGVDGAKELPFAREPLTTAFTYLNFINFDLEILRPGCSGIPSFTYMKKVQATVLFMFLVAVLFGIACLVRLACKRRKMNKVGPAAGDLDFVEDDVDYDLKGEIEGEGDGTAKDADKASVLRRNNTMNKAGPGLGLARQPTAAAQYAVTRQASLTSPAAFLTKLMSDYMWVDFKQRVQNASIILLAIFYLQLAILELKAFRCAMAPDPVESLESDAVVTQSLYLIEDMQTKCYQGAHLLTVVFILLLLVFYTAGFPLACLVFLTRAFATPQTGGLIGFLWQRISWLRGKKKRTRRQSMGMGLGGGSVVLDSAAVTALQTAPAKNKYLAASVTAASAEQIHQDRVARWGMLFVGFRASHFGWSLLVFGVSFWCAAVTVFVDSTQQVQQLFLFGVAWSLQTLFIAWQLPYVAWTDNVQKSAIGVGTLAHSITLLAMQVDGATSAYFFALLAVFIGVVAFLLVRQRLTCKCCRTQLDAVRTQKAAVELIREASKSGRRSRNRHSVTPPKSASQLRQAKADLIEMSQKESATLDTLTSDSAELVEEALAAADTAIAQAEQEEAADFDGVLAAHRLAAEVQRLTQQAEESAAAALRAAMQSACGLPPSLLQVLCASLDGQSINALSADDFGRLLAAAVQRYQESAQARLDQLESTLPESVSTDAAPLAMTPELRHRIETHIRARMAEWTEALGSAHMMLDASRLIGHQPPTTSTALSVSSAVESLLSSEEFAPADTNTDTNTDDPNAPTLDGTSISSACVQQLRVFEVFTPVLVQMSREAAENTQLWDAAQDEHHRQAEAEEQRAAEQMVRPTELDKLIDDIDETDDAAAAAEDDEGDASASSTESKKSAVLGATLLALRFASVQLVAARLRLAKESGDAAQVDAFEKLYRALVDETVTTNAVRVDQRSKADDDMLRRLQKGKTTKQQRVIDAAFSDAALLQVFRLDEAAKQRAASRRAPFYFFLTFITQQPSIALA